MIGVRPVAVEPGAAIGWLRQAPGESSPALGIESVFTFELLDRFSVRPCRTP
jgi:hypothetical protein